MQAYTTGPREAGSIGSLSLMENKAWHTQHRLKLMISISGGQCVTKWINRMTSTERLFSQYEFILVIDDTHVVCCNVVGVQGGYWYSIRLGIFVASDGLSWAKRILRRVGTCRHKRKLL